MSEDDMIESAAPEEVAAPAEESTEVKKAAKPERHMDKTLALKVLKDLDAAVEEISKKHKLFIQLFGCRYNGRYFDFKGFADPARPVKQRKVLKEVKEMSQSVQPDKPKAPRKASATGTATKDRWLIVLAERFPTKPKTVDRRDIEATMRDYADLKWPSWLTADKELRAGRGLFTVPWPTE